MGIIDIVYGFQQGLKKNKQAKQGKFSHDILVDKSESWYFNVSAVRFATG